MRVVPPSHAYLSQRRESRLLSPPPSWMEAEKRPSGTSSCRELSLPLLEVVSEEERGSDNVFESGVIGGGGRQTAEGGQDSEPNSMDKLALKREGETALCGFKGHPLPYCSAPSALQHRLSTDELQQKRVSPYLLAEEESPVCEVWVAASNARHSTISVIDYTQRFTNLEVRGNEG